MQCGTEPMVSSTWLTIVIISASSSETWTQQEGTSPSGKMKKLIESSPLRELSHEKPQEGDTAHKQEDN